MKYYCVRQHDTTDCCFGRFVTLVGGSIAWIVAGLSAAAILAASSYLGGQLTGAGLQAAWCMRKKGKFTLKSTSNPFALLSVS